MHSVFNYRVKRLYSRQCWSACACGCCVERGFRTTPPAAYKKMSRTHKLLELRTPWHVVMSSWFLKAIVRCSTNEGFDEAQNVPCRDLRFSSFKNKRDNKIRVQDKRGIKVRGCTSVTLSNSYVIIFLKDMLLSYSCFTTWGNRCEFCLVFVPSIYCHTYCLKYISSVISHSHHLLVSYFTHTIVSCEETTR